MNPNILHWSYRDFRELPIELIEHSDTLEEIYLKENFIPTLPPWLFQFEHLKFIQLSGNLLQKIPAEIGALINLEHLDVSKNQLNELPHQITRLNKLQFLNASDNKITSLNKGNNFGIVSLFVQQFRFLARNSTQENRLPSVFKSFSIITFTCYTFYIFNAEIGTMKSLETLNLCKNRLTKIPLELAASTSITELLLNDNDLIEVPTKIMAMQSLRVFEAERE